jgi:hypothetical protein
MFHVVQVEAYDSEPPALDRSPSLERLIGDNKFLNPAPFRDLVAQLRIQAADVGTIERSMDAIRREVINPVKDELEKAGKMGKFSFWGFWVGIIGGVLAIVSIVQNMLR